MGALEGGGEVKAAQPRVGFSRPRRRAGVRIDMTPMVDIAFLLLVFFMVTTVFRTPQALEMNMPPGDSKVEVPESDVMTVLVAADEKISFRMGDEPLTRVETKDLKRLFRDAKGSNPELIIIVKLHPKARYAMMVSLFDELELADMDRFSLIEMSEADIAEAGGRS